MVEMFLVYKKQNKTLAAAAAYSRFGEGLYFSVLHRSIESHLCYVSKTVKTISSGDPPETMLVLKLAFLLML